MISENIRIRCGDGRYRIVEHHHTYRSRGWYRILIPSAGAGVVSKGIAFSSPSNPVLTDALADVPLLGEGEISSVARHPSKLKILRRIIRGATTIWDLRRWCQ